MTTTPTFYGLTRPAAANAGKTGALASQNAVQTPFIWPAVYEAQLTEDVSNSWPLLIDGMVQTPVSVSLKDILAMPRDTQSRRWVSAEGFTVRMPWDGIQLKLLLDKAGVLPGATVIRQYNACGQSECMYIKPLLDYRAMLVYGIRGQLFPPAYGGPLRLMVFDRYAYKGLGQITRLEVTNEYTPGLFAPRGLPEDGEILAGNYYAFDLKKHYAIRRSGEITDH